MQHHCLILYGSDIYLHREQSFMPRNPAAWSAWNFLGTVNSKVCLTYWLNTLQVSILISLIFSLAVCSYINTVVKIYTEFR